jgi:hypothetical protein
MSTNPEHPPKVRTRKGGRRQVLIQLRPETIEQLRAAAEAEDRYVYEIIEELVTDYLAQVNFKL